MRSMLEAALAGGTHGKPDIHAAGPVGTKTRSYKLPYGPTFVKQITVPASGASGQVDFYTENCTKNTDPYLLLVRSGGPTAPEGQSFGYKVLAFDDDGNGYPNSRLHWANFDSQPAYVTLFAFAANGLGSQGTCTIRSITTETPNLNGQRVPVYGVGSVFSNVDPYAKTYPYGISYVDQSQFVIRPDTGPVPSGMSILTADIGFTGVDYFSGVTSGNAVVGGPIPDMRRTGTQEPGWYVTFAGTQDTVPSYNWKMSTTSIVAEQYDRSAN